MFSYMVSPGTLAAEPYSGVCGLLIFSSVFSYAVETDDVAAKNWRRHQVISSETRFTTRPVSFNNMHSPVAKELRRADVREIFLIYTVLLYIADLAAVSHSFTYGILYRQSSWVTGRRDSDSDLKGGPLHKAPPAHAHNMLHPLSDECTAPGPSVVSPLAGRSPVGFGVTRQIPPRIPPSPLSPLHHLSCE